MMEKLQRFGGAMFTPVLLFAFAGIMIALSILFTNEMIVGGLAAEGTVWTGIWEVIEGGAWVVFDHMELLFVVGLPIGLAKKANARAALEALIIYLTFTTFVSKIIEFFGPTFNVDFAQEVGGQSGLKMIAGIKTLDTNIIGAIVIAGIAVWIHDRFFEKKLPDWLGIFQGSALVIIIGFFAMIPIAVLVCWIWPAVQTGISSLQGFLSSSGTIGVWLYVFLERLLIPTGLHHFIYQPFAYGPAIVEGGTTAYWLENLNTFASSTEPMKELFPGAAFTFHNYSKVFAPLGIAAAFYATASSDKKKKTLALIIPITLTAVLAGITEPIEFTFLFIAPPLFLLHAILAATLSATAYLLGLSSDMGGGLIRSFAQFIVPMSMNHMDQILLWLGVGLTFSAIYFFSFRYLILKFDYKTPGREALSEVKMYSKKEYKEKVANEKAGITSNVAENEGANQYTFQAAHYLKALGGPENILHVNNCATRLRVKVKDPDLLAPEPEFKAGGAHGLVKKGSAIQVIVGLDVPQVRDQFDQLLASAQIEPI
ncbi:alpha-glucoside-specific PTS transporter subunit IIBC [Carnobacterium inhibens]|uniref:PTS alpha-glucoside transporter subunit IIBC n=1 Tax=Carnobacterium inhibens TaxID=147709 RepID=A0ABR7T969_9LACT|nr:alpha-glucoside-specific PTS transporter subunit IIBC [Carnobacterium inhibens]MBC9824548.1 PTS alpha-glucoside transporter subunit IIBC [Carnobacterium inhibens]